MQFDKSKFIEQFKAETRDHIQKLNLGILELEKNPQNHELLNTMMREAHTIKGSATMMGYKRIADVAHKMEDGFEKAVNNKVVLTKDHFDVIFKCLDAIEPLLEDKVAWADKGVARPYVEELCEEVEAVFSGQKKSEKKAAGPEPSKEEPADKKPAKKEKPRPPEAAKDEGPNLPQHDASPHAETSMRVDIDRLDKMMNLSGELVISKIRLNDIVKDLYGKVEAERGLEGPISSLVKDLRTVNNEIDMLTSNMQTEIMNVRLLPIGSLFNIFPRAMRSLAQTKGKDIDFEMKGGETELDKTIIDEMKDPLMHLLRNAVDHGIESAEKRSGEGKPATGKITLSAYQLGSQVIIEVSDDGMGIDSAKVREQAVKKGLVAKERISDLAEEQVLQLIFTPGFSTADEVTETSGRGVGLDVVREKVGKLKGMVEVVSSPGVGTKFVVKLPLTLAMTESLLVGAGDDVFTIPVERVVETVRIHLDDIKSVETKDAITVRGHILPLVRIADMFGLPKRGIIEKAYFPVIIVQSVEKRLAILVDRLLGRQEIVSKAIGAPLGNVKNIAGATILGNGKVVLILDIPSMIDSAEGVIRKRPAAAPRRAVAKKKKTILIAEDAMTTAMLEKNILESVGYSVVIARDGQEALARAGQERFDLVISDILMPRMDGFELTSRLKKDPVYKDIPVIIVTTRESDDDKRRGLESGADAYLLKSEFTSDTLLDTIERLIG
jgi:two-component system chemotaxis sensor kinase CheA